MTQRYLTHLGTVFLIHALLILGGVKLFQTEFVQKQIGDHVLNLKVAQEVISSSVNKLVTPRKKQIARSAVVTQAPPSVPSTAVTETSTISESVSRIDAAQINGMRDVYKAGLRAKIDQNKHYPSMSKRLGQQGEVIVAFTLLADGTIINIRIASASRFKPLDESALDAVKSVGKYRPIPKELELAKMDLKVPIRFLTR